MTTIASQSPVHGKKLIDVTFFLMRRFFNGNKHRPDLKQITFSCSKMLKVIN